MQASSLASSALMAIIRDQILEGLMSSISHPGTLLRLLIKLCTVYIASDGTDIPENAAQIVRDADSLEAARLCAFEEQLRAQSETVAERGNGGSDDVHDAHAQQKGASVAVEQENAGPKVDEHATASGRCSDSDPSGLHEEPSYVFEAPDDDSDDGSDMGSKRNLSHESVPEGALKETEQLALASTQQRSTTLSIRVIVEVVAAEYDHTQKIPLFQLELRSLHSQTQTAMKGATTQIQRTFNAFQQLHASLRARYPRTTKVLNQHFPSLPKPMPASRDATAQICEVIRLALDKYIHELCRTRLAASSQFHDFIQGQEWHRQQTSLLRRARDRISRAVAMPFNALKPLLVRDPAASASHGVVYTSSRATQRTSPMSRMNKLLDLQKGQFSRCFIVPQETQGVAEHRQRLAIPTETTSYLPGLVVFAHATIDLSSHWCLAPQRQPIVLVFLSGLLDRIAVDLVDLLLAEEQILTYINSLQDTFWLQGVWFPGVSREPDTDESLKQLQDTFVECLSLVLPRFLPWVFGSMRYKQGLATLARFLSNEQATRSLMVHLLSCLFRKVEDSEYSPPPCT
eukprot:m.91080 g.91080  ORF g.91080 m.91080 type:complete len:572 (-) comp12937_c0_seq5:330-2045(-)